MSVLDPFRANFSVNEDISGLVLEFFSHGYLHLAMVSTERLNGRGSAWHLCCGEGRRVIWAVQAMSRTIRTLGNPASRADRGNLVVITPYCAGVCRSQRKGLSPERAQRRNNAISADGAP